MKIGEVSDITGLAPSAIRFYEQSGLLPEAERGSNGYRSYTQAAVTRLQLIQVAQNLGFTLDTLRSLFGAPSQFPEDELQARLDARVQEIDAVMATLRAQRKAVLALRQQVGEAWANGECLAVADLIYGMAAKPLPKLPAKGGKRKASA